MNFISAYCNSWRLGYARRTSSSLVAMRYSPIMKQEYNQKYVNIFPISGLMMYRYISSTFQPLPLSPSNLSYRYFGQKIPSPTLGRELQDLFGIITGQGHYQSILLPNKNIKSMGKEYVMKDFIINSTSSFISSFVYITTASCLSFLTQLR